MKNNKTEIEKLREYFDITPVPDFTDKEYLRKMYKEFTEAIHPDIQDIRLRHALAIATAHTRVYRGLF